MNLPNFPEVDLFSAGINALYGVLVARQPSHDRDYTAAGLLIMAFFGGIGGGVSRDVLLNDIPAPLRDPSYLFVCLLMGLLGLAIYQLLRPRRRSGSAPGRWPTSSLSRCPGSRFWERIRRSTTISGSSPRSSSGLIATTAGGVFIDLFSGVTPEIVRPSEQLVTTAVLASTVYTLLAVLTKGSLSSFPSR